MRYQWLPVGLIRQEELKDTECILDCPMIRLRVPIVEFAHQGQGLCCRGPLAVPQSGLPLMDAAVKAVVFVACVGGKNNERLNSNRGGALE